MTQKPEGPFPARPQTSDDRGAIIAIVARLLARHWVRHQTVAMPRADTKTQDNPADEAKRDWGEH